jgi:hypothetical protein
MPRLATVLFPMLLNGRILAFKTYYSGLFGKENPKEISGADWAFSPPVDRIWLTRLDYHHRFVFTSWA